MNTIGEYHLFVSQTSHTLFTHIYDKPQKVIFYIQKITAITNLHVFLTQNSIPVKMITIHVPEDIKAPMQENLS